ncbi:unnamed protein product [Leuciscus chuanchicus]
MASKRDLIHSPAKKKHKDDEHLHDAIAEMLDKHLSAIKLSMSTIVHEEISTITARLESLEKDVKSFGNRWRTIEIEWAHRLYANEDPSRNRARTLIFKLLRYNDRQAILQGAKSAPPLSYEGGIESFLLYPASVKVRNGQGHLFFKTPGDLERFIASLSATTGMDTTAPTGMSDE